MSAGKHWSLMNFVHVYATRAEWRNAKNGWNAALAGPSEPTRHYFCGTNSLGYRRRLIMVPRRGLSGFRSLRESLFSCRWALIHSPELASLAILILRPLSGYLSRHSQPDTILKWTQRQEVRSESTSTSWARRSSRSLVKSWPATGRSTNIRHEHVSRRNHKRLLTGQPTSSANLDV